MCLLHTGHLRLLPLLLDIVLQYLHLYALFTYGHVVTACLYVRPLPTRGDKPGESPPALIAPPLDDRGLLAICKQPPCLVTRHLEPVVRRPPVRIVVWHIGELRTVVLRVLTHEVRLMRTMEGNQPQPAWVVQLRH